MSYRDFCDVVIIIIFITILLVSVQVVIDFIFVQKLLLTST